MSPAIVDQLEPVKTSGGFRGHIAVCHVGTHLLARASKRRPVAASTRTCIADQVSLLKGNALEPRRQWIPFATALNHPLGPECISASEHAPWCEVLAVTGANRHDTVVE